MSIFDGITNMLGNVPVILTFLYILMEKIFRALKGGDLGACLSSRCYNKIPQAAWLINNLFFIVLEAENPRSG